jgi:RNA polymerase sigma-70 factor (ECF subfamily)
MEIPVSTETTTEILVARAQAGDRPAFDEIVRRYRDRLGKQIRARLGAKLKAKMEVGDVLQETFSVAFRSIGKFRWRDEESFYRWLGGIAEHHLLSSSQKKAWDEIRLTRDVSGAGLSPSKALRREERFDRLEDTLSSLSEEHRKVILLARIEGLPVAEIAARLKRSPGAVKMLLARALLRLKESFGDTESLGLPRRSLEAEGRDPDG